MTFSAGLSFAAACATLIVLAVSIVRGPRSSVQNIFAAAMLLLALEAALIGLVYQAASLSNFLFWQRLLFIITSLVPAA